MKVKPKITIDNFAPCVPWQQIEMTLGKSEYKRFLKWMYGQTVPIGGVYAWDLERFLDGLPVID